MDRIAQQKPMQLGESFQGLMGKQRHWFAVFKCGCGQSFITRPQSVATGKTKSCGCYRVNIRAEKNTTHGKAHSKAYSVWQGMIQRCQNANRWNWERYGGRGITVSDQWKDFNQFYQDMGDPPDGLTLDRINNEKGYSKENCRWATLQQQAGNRRCSIKSVGRRED
jgi:hypothetical protein